MVDFEFDLRFEVVEFRVTMIVSGTPIEKYTKGPALSGEMKEMFQKAKPGQKVYIGASRPRVGWHHPQPGFVVLQRWSGTTLTPHP